MSTLTARAEVDRLARVLDVDPARLGFLERVPAGDLRALRRQVNNVLFDADRSALQRVAAASRMLPAPLVAGFAEKGFGPLLSARVAGLVEPSRAADLAGRLPVPFLAELCVALDPRRVPEVIPRVPPARVFEIAAELARQGEFATLANFVGYLPDERLLATVDVLDDEALLRTAFAMEDITRLEHLVELLPEERLRGIVRAAGSVGLWPEALALMNGVNEAQRGRLADFAVDEGEAVLDGLLGTAREQGLWDAVLPLVRPMSEANRRRLASLPALHDEEVLAGVVRTAAGDDELWPDLLPLVSLLPEHARRHVEEHARRLGVADRLGESSA